MENLPSYIVGEIFYMRRLFLFLICYFFLFAHATKTIQRVNTNSVDSIVVYKSQKIMTLYSQRIPIKKITISIGENPIGHKQKQGDNPTPEGFYTITDKNSNSAYYKNLGISYPNQKDKNQAKKNHVSPGGNIKIHGYTDTQGSSKNRLVRYAYTWGCINVCNADMDEVYDWVKVGSVIYICP